MVLCDTAFKGVSIPFKYCDKRRPQRDNSQQTQEVESMLF